MDDAAFVVLCFFVLLCCTAVAFFFIARRVPSDEAESLWSMISIVEKQIRKLNMEVVDLKEKLKEKSE